MLVERGAPLARTDLGGKGAALDRLVQLGFAVPPTAIVPASAYRVIAAHPDLAELFDRLADPTTVVPADIVDAAFLAVPVPGWIGAAVVESARRVGGGGPVAVRSSATVEDMALASFAGQYRSSLDVDGDEAVMRAVRLTWASLWHPAPRTYRGLWGIASDDIAMAVVIMRMVPARTAGVAFTVDLGGAPDRVRVEAVPELGEALVSGARTPDVWLVPRQEDQRDELRPPPPIAEAADLALRVERACGSPQDVEWAWDGGQLWLVQARPITVGTVDRADECETPADGCELTTNGIGEMLPGVIPPLVWDVASNLVEEALRTVFAELHSLPPLPGGEHEFVRRVHGRAALNLDLLAAAATAMPGGSGPRSSASTSARRPGPAPGSGGVVDGG